MGVFHWTTGPLPFPHRCTRCGNESRKCLDLGVEFQTEGFSGKRGGAILICTACFEEAMRMTSTYVLSKVEEANSVRAATFRESIKKGQELANNLNDLFDYFDSSSLDGIASSTVVDNEDSPGDKGSDSGDDSLQRAFSFMAEDDTGQSKSDGEVGKSGVSTESETSSKLDNIFG